MIADYEGDITDLFDISTLDEIPILATRNLMMFPELSCRYSWEDPQVLPYLMR